MCAIQASLRVRDNPPKNKNCVTRQYNFYILANGTNVAPTESIGFIGKKMRTVKVSTAPAAVAHRVEVTPYALCRATSSQRRRTSTARKRRQRGRPTSRSVKHRHTRSTSTVVRTVHLPTSALQRIWLWQRAGLNHRYQAALAVDSSGFENSLWGSAHPHQSTRAAPARRGHHCTRRHTPLTCKINVRRTNAHHVDKRLSTNSTTVHTVLEYIAL